MTRPSTLICNPVMQVAIISKAAFPKECKVPTCLTEWSAAAATCPAEWLATAAIPIRVSQTI